ncbi:MAG: PAS domain S-box protein [Acidobacteriota bacterium]
MSKSQSKSQSSRRKQTVVFRYVVPVLSVAVAAVLSPPLVGFVDTIPLFYAAVIVSSWYGGRGPGLLSVLLGTLAVNYIIVPPMYAFNLGVTDLVQMGAFAVLALTISLLSTARRRAEGSLRQAHDEMETKVIERTADLKQSNEKLHGEIAERRRMEGILRERANLLDLTHDTVFVRDMNDVITYWNRGAEEMYGWASKEAIGQVSHDVLRTRFPAPLEQINEELSGMGRWEGELIHTKRDGTQIVVASRWSLQRDEQARAVAVLETNNDITQSKRAEEALQRQANLLEQTHDAIFAWEFSRSIIYWNRGAEQLYGFSREEAIGRLSHELLHTEHSLPTPVFEAILEREGEWTGELKHTTRDGRKIIVESRHVLTRDTDDRWLVLETNRDVTERKLAEDALHKAQAELAHVNRVATLGEMTASIAHEVNQPLAAVVTNANACIRWLAHQPPNLAEARQAVGRIIREGNRASDVIGRIRALVRKTPPRKDWFNINEIILEVIALTRSEVHRNRVSLKPQLSDGLPLVLADRIQLQQVILNLIMNGLEAMSGVVDRSRELQVSSGMNDSAGVLVSVLDSGKGLDPGSLDHLFDAFFTTKPEGMGMGLAISHSIILAHGGLLWASPNSPWGAVFQFTLPPGAEKMS